jgi:hypothetical protein
MSYESAFGPALIIQHTGQIFPLTEEPITVGRATDNTLMLADPEVSGHHAVVFWQGDVDSGTARLVAQDLGSTNGTFVNERRVEKPQLLDNGDVIRMGNTIMEVRLEGATETVALAEGGAYSRFDDTPSDDRPGAWLLPGLIAALLAGITVACLALILVAFLGGRRGVPIVTIQSPPDGTQVVVGNEIVLQAAASGASDITLVELSVDGSLVATSVSPNPEGRSTLTVSKPWIFDTAGPHIVSAVAYTARDRASRTEAVEIAVVQAGGVVGPVMTNTPTPTEVTPELTATASATPTTRPESTRSPSPAPGSPQIEFFLAEPQSISGGDCATLEWGVVSNATEVAIEPGVGGVGTPGRSTVCPAQTTTYILTARGPGGTTSVSTTVTVVGALADLAIDSVDFQPSPPLRGQDTEVRISIRNAGAGPAGSFAWSWQAGDGAGDPAGQFGGQLAGLNPGETVLVAVRWRPANAYARLTTVARVDVNNQVAETDEGNNEWVAVIQVVEGTTGPTRITLQSEAALDGYWANVGRGRADQDILAGNGQIVEEGRELVWRGFMSFDLSGLPPGASIEDAELRFFQAKTGGNPYGKLGNLVLDHVDYGSSLTDGAFDAPAMDSVALPPQVEPGSWYVVSRGIADWVRADLAAGRGRSQFRVRWAQESDGDGIEDYAGIESGNNFFETGNFPQFIVTYQP